MKFISSKQKYAFKKLILEYSDFGALVSILHKTRELPEGRILVLGVETFS
jgi:hypothetical protein